MYNCKFKKAANPRIMERKTAKNLPFWRIADEMNMCEATLQRRLRHQLPADQEAEVLEAIEKAAARMAAEESAEN